jgi:hypothetical protein
VTFSQLYSEVGEVVGEGVVGSLVVGTAEGEDVGVDADGVAEGALVGRAVGIDVGVGEGSAVEGAALGVLV